MAEKSAGRRDSRWETIALLLIDVFEANIYLKIAKTINFSGLSMSISCTGMLISSNKDGTVKVWDVTNHLEPQLVAEKQTNVGQIMCLEASCDSPFTFAIGGDNKAHYLSLFNATKLDKGMLYDL